MSAIRCGFGLALLVAIVGCFACSTDSNGGGQGAAGQGAGGGVQGGAGVAGAAQMGGAPEAGAAGADAAAGTGADAGEDAGGSAGERSEPGSSSGGPGEAGRAGAGNGGGGGSGGSGGHATAGSSAVGGGSGSEECAWDPVLTGSCPICDVPDGCARPGYKYVGSGAITASCCGLQWQEETAPGKHTWHEAIDYCASLSLLGLSWRLPKIAELYSLVELSDEAQSAPAIDVDAFADTVRESYWSASPDGKSGQAAWSVNFSDGATQSVQTDEPHKLRVRCVL